MLKAKKNRVPSEELMHRIKRSDEYALKILYDRLWEKMYSLAYAILKDSSLSRDIVQEIWISIWIRRTQIDNENIEAYILRATRFQVYKHLRDSKTIRIPHEFLESIQASENDGILQKLYEEDTKSKIRKAVENLPKKCQEVFVLSRNKGLKNAEISKKLGISQRTVETHVSNAIRMVKSQIVIPLALILATFF
ncbi:RNA polymerase sigma factor [Maribacter antarcticus]|uniref:RNA polymerase sigma factor n=1 Tax=Maribacter antarcticus TaxID=505250 RepID=UPI000683E23B|nr:sigma-70 family RNA polymerase sigma factor [Maribacter antarcticus]